MSQNILVTDNFFFFIQAAGVYMDVNLSVATLMCLAKYQAMLKRVFSLLRFFVVCVHHFQHALLSFLII